MPKTISFGRYRITVMIISAITFLLFQTGSKGNVMHLIRAIGLFVISAYAIVFNHRIALEQQNNKPTTRKQHSSEDPTMFLYRLALVAIGLIVAAGAFVYAISENAFTG